MRHLRLFLVLMFLCAIIHPVAADTGTYTILKYSITLTPHSDGKVDIDYYQQWQVTSGFIPWITVGLPNGEFEITKSGDTVKTIRPANEGSWSGVRIDLDRNYHPGQTFAISFSVSQNRLFYADDRSYKLDFTPGWYDRARIETLEIRLKSFANVETITTSPEPTATAEEELTWTKTGMGEGERFPVSISFPKTLIPNGVPIGSLYDGSQDQGGQFPQGDYSSRTSPGEVLFGIYLLIFIFGPLIVIAILNRRRSGRRRRYTGGNIFWDILLNTDWGGSSRGGRGGRSTGGGGGFGGGGFSCACACVSCACACACAGGGGAGCSRKNTHSCPACEERRRDRAKAAS